CALGAILSSALLAAQAQAAVPNPAVQGPIEGGIHGYPWNHSLFPLSGSGYSYTENEYFFSGTATNLEKGVSAPYTSRMLVRLPTDPAKVQRDCDRRMAQRHRSEGHRDAVANHG